MLERFRYIPAGGGGCLVARGDGFRTAHWQASTFYGRGQGQGVHTSLPNDSVRTLTATTGRAHMQYYVQASEHCAQQLYRNHVDRLLWWLRGTQTYTMFRIMHIVVQFKWLAVQVMDRIQGQNGLSLPWEGTLSPVVRRQLGIFRASVLQLLSRNPSERPSMAEFCVSCDRVLAGSTSVQLWNIDSGWCIPSRLVTDQASSSFIW